jgi:hypothetical protein
MIIGRQQQLGESDDWESQQAAAWTPEAQGAVTFESPQSSITIYPTTIGPAKVVPRTGPTKALDKVMPKRQGPDGTVRIWGMPPAVAYTLAAIALGGAGWLAYRQLGGGGRRVATNPRRRRGSRGGKARRKR